MITAERIQNVVFTSGEALVAGALVVGATSTSTANPLADGESAATTSEEPPASPLGITPEQMALAAKKAKQMQIAAAKRAKLRAHRSSGPMFTPTTNFNYSARFGQAGGSWSSGHHTGLDFAAPSGTPVFSALAGKVVEAGWGGAYGNHIIVRHDNGVETLYAHLTSASVDAGDRVLRGQRIGSVGSTGNSSGPHLHFEVLRNGTQRDPAAFL
jgi:murein DD-endopeptidase MepM/ murein hydrolase activator NlpD